jgi:ribosomal protein S18 acetylase RimI-like enzyme
VEASGWTAEPAARADPTELLELTAGLRRELLRRGEHLSAGWPEEAVEDLRRGSLDGVVLRHGGILSVRPERAFGHLHLAEGPDAADAALELFAGLVALVPVTVARIDFGITGLDADRETGLQRSLRAVPGFEVIRRFGLHRPLSLERPPASPVLPPGFEFGDVRDLGLESLGAVDWAAFRGSPDATFIADSPEGNRRLLEGILAGQLGRFLDEASFTLLGPSARAAGFLLSVEESPRVAVFVDLAVAPEVRRQGLGRSLLLQGLRALLALGYTGARLWVTETNRPARRLYESMGFQPHATASIYRWRRPAVAAAPSPQVAR